MFWLTSTFIVGTENISGGRDLWTLDYRTPMRGSLLWYMRGYAILGDSPHCTIYSVHRDYVLSELAFIAALESEQPGRQWRPLIHTTTDPARGIRGRRLGQRTNEGRITIMKVPLSGWKPIRSSANGRMAHALG